MCTVCSKTKFNIIFQFFFEMEHGPKEACEVKEKFQNPLCLVIVQPQSTCIHIIIYCNVFSFSACYVWFRFLLFYLFSSECYQAPMVVDRTEYYRMYSVLFGSFQFSIFRNFMKKFLPPFVNRVPDFDIPFFQILKTLKKLSHKHNNTGKNQPNGVGMVNLYFHLL